jgi:hypothetical protein
LAALCYLETDTIQPRLNPFENGADRAEILVLARISIDDRHPIRDGLDRENVRRREHVGKEAVVVPSGAHHDPDAPRPNQSFERVIQGQRELVL